MHSPARAADLFRAMARIRAFENAAEEASRGGVAAFGASLSAAKIRGPLHLSTGQEAVAAGVCLNLENSDYITSTHRGHGHTLAKGASMERTMCELFGRASGFNGGKDIKTPNSDALAAKGPVFGSYYVQPLRSTTRATLLTGRYPVHHGIYGALKPESKGGLPLEERTLAQALKWAARTGTPAGKNDASGGKKPKRNAAKAKAGA